jgi:uncharacterized protein YuzE
LFYWIFLCKTKDLIIVTAIKGKKKIIKVVTTYEQDVGRRGGIMQLIKKYEKDIDLIYLRVDHEYHFNRTIDAGDIIIDIDKDNQLVSVEILQASRVLKVLPRVLEEDDFNVNVEIRSEGSEVLVDASFSFKDSVRHVHAKTNIQGISISKHFFK